jgi:hypothetical protein
VQGLSGETSHMVSAGGTHTLLLRSDGCAVACVWNFRGECDIPPLDEGVKYTQVSAGSTESGSSLSHSAARTSS